VSLSNNRLTITTTNIDVNGWGDFDLVLTDLGGLTGTLKVSVTITAVNDPPTIILNQPGMAFDERWGINQIGTSIIPVQWYPEDPEGDALVANIYYSIADGSWFTVVTGTPTTSGVFGSYNWDTVTVLDDNRYKVRVEVVETATLDLYSAVSQSANFFTIDNQALIIDPLVPDPQIINPTFTEGTLLPFELSEPATVTVEVLDPALAQVTSTNWGWMSAGIHATSWDGRDQFGTLVVPPNYVLQDYSFRVRGIDSLGNTTIISSNTDPLVGPVEVVTIRVKRPVIANVSDSPDPFNPFPPVSQPTAISYTLFTDEPALDGIFDLWVTVRLEDESGGFIANLFDEKREAHQGGVTYTDPWDGTGVTENGIFKYIISAIKVKYNKGTGKYTTLKVPPVDNEAAPKSGVITALNLNNIAITSSPDSKLTIYSQPATSTVTIVQNPTLGSDVTYALGSIITPGAVAPVYPVSAFYDIEAVTPLVTPTIIAFRFSPDLSPDNLKLFRYDETTKRFVAEGLSIVDPINHILYVEVDTLSLFVLMMCSDSTKPAIQDLALTYQVLDFTIKDDLSGINVLSIKVILDGTDITDKLTITGKTGDLAIIVSGRDIFQSWFDMHTMIISVQDRAGNEVTRTISFIAGFADVQLVIKPESLNINPGVLTAYVKFPVPFGIPKVLNATLDGAPSERWEVSNEGLPEEDIEGPIVIMKFRREDIEKALSEKGETLDTEFILKGTFDDGTALYSQLYTLEGRDTITKIITEETPSSGPPEQPPGKGDKKK